MIIIISIRKANTKDIEFISEICVETDEIYSGIMPNAFIRQSEKYKVNGLPSSYDIYVISLEDNDIGFLGLQEIDRNTIYLTAIYLKKNLYRKSYGSKTLNLICDNLKSKCVREIFLQAHKDATWPINFYKKHGFNIEEKSQIEGVKILANAVVMKKDLTVH